MQIWLLVWLPELRHCSIRLRAVDKKFKIGYILLKALVPRGKRYGHIVAAGIAGKTQRINRSKTSENKHYYLMGVVYVSEPFRPCRRVGNIKRRGRVIDKLYYR